MAGVTVDESHRLLNASFGRVAYPAPTTPMMLALATATSTDTTPGTEVTGGSYTRQALDTANAPANKRLGNSASEVFTNMPAVTVSDLDIYDSSATPRRSWYGKLSTARTLAAGDSLSFAADSIGASLGV